ncbi:MAG: hypothetical protein LAT67_00345 [Balneolales bacterium]|nr:hypothetical protein [Balneolales bacterium]
MNNKRKIAHFTWLIPLFLLALLVQQISVLNGITITYDEGETVQAFITDFRIKQIAAQTNGYVDLMFFDASGEQVRERLSLHAQHASRLIGSNEVEIRYLPGTTYDIVITKTYEYHRNTVLINLAVILFSMVITVGISIWASRYATGRNNTGESSRGGTNVEFEIMNKPEIKQV